MIYMRLIFFPVKIICHGIYYHEGSIVNLDLLVGKFMFFSTKFLCMNPVDSFLLAFPAFRLNFFVVYPTPSSNSSF